MRPTGTIFLVGISLLSSGCTSKQVQLYAERLDAFLVEYRASVKGQLDAERRVYDQVSAVFATEAERNVYEGLKIERIRQQRIVTGDLADGRLKPSQVTERVRETAIREFDTTRTWFEQELTAQRQYQSGLAKLAVDAKKLDALDSALNAVQKDTGLRAALNDITTLGQSFQTEFRLQSCKEIERSVAISTDSLAELKAQKASSQNAAETVALTKQIEMLTTTLAATSKTLEAQPNFKAATKKCQ